ncbi:MAG: Bax inhibitor-1/YccA family membrane protein [Micromonosporaceae bacterium]
MRSSNPVLTRLTPERPATAGQPAYPGTGYSTALATDRMTIDDVVVRTVGLLALTAVAGAAAWILIPEAYAGAAWIGAAIVGVVLGLVITLARLTNPLLIAAYAVVEGVFVGMVSRFYESAFQGIILQAAVGTFGVFLLMAVLYRFQVIRATPRFVRGVIGATFGIFAIILVNWLLSIFGVNTGLRDGSGLAIVFSLVVITVAALNFILDFNLIEEAVRAGAPRQFAWLCAVGILIGLIWVYIEILRLLSYLRR